MLRYIKISSKFTKDAKLNYSASQAFKVTRSAVIASLTEDVTKADGDALKASQAVNALSDAIKKSKPEKAEALQGEFEAEYSRLQALKRLRATFLDSFEFSNFITFWDSATSDSGTVNFKSVELLLNGFLLGLSFQPEAKPEETPQETVDVETVNEKTGRKETIKAPVSIIPELTPQD